MEEETGSLLLAAVRLTSVMVNILNLGGVLLVWIPQIGLLQRVVALTARLSADQLGSALDLLVVFLLLVLEGP